VCFGLEFRRKCGHFMCGSELDKLLCGDGVGVRDGPAVDVMQVESESDGTVGMASASRP
jgi:hypothetical protein